MDDVEEGSECLVIDNGSGMIKAGFSGEDAPRSVFATVVGTPTDPENYQRARGVEGRDTFVGNEAQQQREFLALTNPIERGVITDWDAMEKVWEYALQNELRVDPETMNLPVLLTDTPLNPKVNREKMAQIMFETFKVPGFYIAPQAVLSLYASGRTRGIVVESGEGVSHAVPVFEGYALPHAILRMDLAGQDLTAYLLKMLREKGLPFNEGSMDIVRDIKEKMCHVALDYDAATRAGGGGDQGDKAYELPDGQVIGIDHACRVACPEALFRPSLLGNNDMPGITDLTYESINMCDNDLKTDLFNSIVLAGGSSMFSGFADRIGNEVFTRAPGGTKVRVIPDSQRKFASWIGGSMFASLGTFGQIQITKQEYDDCHESVVHRKCL